MLQEIEMEKSLSCPLVFFVPSMVVAWLVGEVGAILGGWTWLEAKSEAMVDISTMFFAIELE